MPTRYNTVVSQTQPEEWVICWHNKHEIIFTQIHIIPHTKGGGDRGKEANFGKLCEEYCYIT